MMDQWRQWLTIRLMPVAALVLTLAGCGTEPTSQTPIAEPLVLDSDSFVDSFLLTDDELHRWRFSPGQFVVEGSSVFVKVYRVDDQGRDVAQVWGPNYQYVNVKLLSQGLAWHDKRQSSDWVFATAEDDARSEQRGLWKQSHPVPPWKTNVAK